MVSAHGPYRRSRNNTYITPQPFRTSDLLQALEGVRSALQSSRHVIAEQAGLVSDAIIADLAEHCAGVLKQLRGITATYRQLPPPTRMHSTHIQRTQVRVRHSG